MNKQNNTKIAVLLMTYGSPQTLDDVPSYLKNVYGGKDPKEETIAEFKRRYALIGGSPLVEITQAQAKELEKELTATGDGNTYVVAAGMRFSDPFIADVVAAIAQDADELVGIIMSPQYSPIIMQGYIRTLTESVEKLQRPALKLKIATDWHMEGHFLHALAQRVREALETFPESERNSVPVLFSAHSMPKRVIENEPHYISDLKETASAVADLVGLDHSRWMFCYQSAGHTPEEWLKPDFEDLMPELAKKGEKSVLIAPVQFLSDHLEILYDVGIGAREQAEKYGIHFARTQSLNTSPLFIQSLAATVFKTLAQ